MNARIRRKKLKKVMESTLADFNRKAHSCWVDQMTEITIRLAKEALEK